MIYKKFTDSKNNQKSKLGCFLRGTILGMDGNLINREVIDIPKNSNYSLKTIKYYEFSENALIKSWVPAADGAPVFNQ